MKLKELRNLHNLKQIEVANMLNVGQTTYSGYEKGIIMPSIQNLIILADYYNVSLDYLFGISNFMNENEKMPLSEEIELFKQAENLYKLCNDYLENAKGDIYKIKRDLELYREEKFNTNLNN